MPKPGNRLEDVKPYWPISLLPVLKNCFWKDLSLSLININLYLNVSSGLDQQHATTVQIHRIRCHINETVEENSAPQRWDISQIDLLYKLRKTHPLNYFLIPKSYLENRHFLVHYQDEQNTLYPSGVGVPQRSILRRVLYLLYTGDLPTKYNVMQKIRRYSLLTTT